jgi:hypothetical protein
VLLTNKDRVSGKLAALAGGTLTLELSAESVKLPLSRVEAVVFAHEQSVGSSSGRRQPTESSPSPSLERTRTFIVGTRDGSLVYAEILVGDENKVALQLAGGLTLKCALEDVALLQMLGGPFVYLSDLEPEGYQHIPYLSIKWPQVRDRNVLGEPLSVDGKRYLKGIGMHSAARLTYRLEDRYRRLDAAVAIDDSARKRGSVTFGAYVFRDGEWSEAYTSGTVRGGEAPRSVSVDVAGAQGLTLTVDYADRGDELDHADWLDARLVKAEM